MMAIAHSCNLLMDGKEGLLFKKSCFIYYLPQGLLKEEKKFTPIDSLTQCQMQSIFYFKHCGRAPRGVMGVKRSEISC